MPNVYVTITVDWEGRDLINDGIKAMTEFRKTFPAIPITHFICPSYFTRNSDSKTVQEIANAINSVIDEKIDEVALHIHCWYSLMMFSNSNLKQPIMKPTFMKNDGPGRCVDTPGQLWGNQDCGHAVPLGLYDQSQIRNTLVTGVQLIQSAKIKDTGPIESFRCGMWVASDNVLEALKQANFKYEASATPGKYFKEKIYPEDQLPGDLWIYNIWSDAQKIIAPTYLTNGLRLAAYPGGITGLYPLANPEPISQPAQMKINGNGLIQIPDTAVLADYVSVKILQTHIDQAKNTGKDTFISMGWHDTTAVSANYYDKPKTNIQVIAEAINHIPQGSLFLTIRDAAKLVHLLAEGVQPTITGEVDTQAIMPHIPPTGPSIREI